MKLQIVFAERLNILLLKCWKGKDTQWLLIGLVLYVYFYLGLVTLWYADRKASILLKGQGRYDEKDSDEIDSFSWLLIISRKVVVEVFIWEKVKQ